VNKPVLTADLEQAAAVRRIRTKAERAIDRLIALLDDLSEDPDIEDGADDEEEPDREIEHEAGDDLYAS
jgi:hypothetical protein